MLTSSISSKCAHFLNRTTILALVLVCFFLAVDLTIAENSVAKDHAQPLEREKIVLVNDQELTLV